jgi:plasmid stabilization system protein ParE
MNYEVVFTDVAEMEAEEAFLWLAGHYPEYAGQWREQLDQALASLREFPHQCPVARESYRFDVEVRSLRFAKYRLLFTIVDTDGDGVEDSVRVLHLRHTARGEF